MLPIPERSINGALAGWRACLASAFRTAFACTIVGCTTLYGPAFLQRQVAFPAFSYVTVILIIGPAPDATVGDALRGCWLGLYATVQSVVPAILSLWVIGPTGFSSFTTALAVALFSFVVVLPESTHLVAKRIALAQIVLVYVIAFINGARAHPVMHPVHVAASTALGVLACLLALLLPYPRLAYFEVKQNCKLLAENASERLKLFVGSICADDTASALASISQAKSIAGTGSKLLSSLKRHQESMKWEGFSSVTVFGPWHINHAGERLQDIEISFRGMEMALTSTPSYPVNMRDGKLKDGLLRLEEHLSLRLKRTKSFSPYDQPTVPESSAEDVMKFLLTLETIPTAHQDLPSYFFFFCMTFLHSKVMPKPSASEQDNAVKKNENSTGHHPSKANGFSLRGVLSNWPMKVNSKRLMPALKCSLSLGFAVLFGLLYSKENGYWSALPVAITLASAREATFKVANVKAQGTVLGTVYGVLCCFLFRRFLPIRFLSLLPWIIFTSFLQRSRMYGQAGGISAVIGAVIILGRKNFGPPSQFAIARIIETFIGLTCSMTVELLVQPTRASTLAKIQLSKSFGTLHACVTSGSQLGGGSSISELRENQKRLQMQVSELRKAITEAEVEPNFRSLPFHSACYSKLLKSLSKMADLLLLSAHAVGFLQQASQLELDQGRSWKEFVNKLDDDLKLFEELVGSSTKCFEQVTSIKSLTLLEKELSKNNFSSDLESGKRQKPNTVLDEREREKMMDSFLQHSKELVDRSHGANELKCGTVLSLAALGFCISSLVKEITEIEKDIKELLQWENPSSHIDLNDISCKIHNSSYKSTV